jgi:Flp pilus assembly protein TadG
MMFKKTSQKGQSLVEVALAIPILILIVMGILDLGRAYFTYVALSDAAAEGAAYAAIHPAETTQIVARTTDSASGMVVLGPEMVSIDYTDLTPGSSITVTVEYEYQILTPIINSFVPEGKISLKAIVAQPIINDL